TRTGCCKERLAWTFPTPIRGRLRTPREQGRCAPMLALRKRLYSEKHLALVCSLEVVGFPVFALPLKVVPASRNVVTDAVRINDAVRISVKFAFYVQL